MSEKEPILSPSRLQTWGREDFVSAAPVVVLEKAFTTPFKNVVATARTCYSSKGIIGDDQITDQQLEIANSIYQAGHHTTFQHAHYQFRLANVSRHFIWSFLHSHPFYNSEQVSQRYVPVQNDTFAIPPLTGRALELYIDTARQQMQGYHELVKQLHPLVESEYAKRFPLRVIPHPKHQRTIKKKAMEVARYVIPVATFAYLYHTVSAITLLRYYRLCQQWDCPLETSIVVRQMVDAMLKHDPLFARVMEEPIELEATPEAEFFHSGLARPDFAARRLFREEFDASLDGLTSKLIATKPNNETILAQSVREVLGVPASELSDEAAIELVLSPERNRLLGESLNLRTISKLTRALVHPHYTFRRKLSHTADSQDQRHRMTPASRPILLAHLSDEPDVITPTLIRLDSDIESRYQELMNLAWERIHTLHSLGVPLEFAAYLLPNAVAVRFTESCDLAALHHKHAMRLCYNAQEEIWKASVEEAQQIRAIEPCIGKYLLPPCGLRQLAATRPICPEGDRFCGEKVWQYDIIQYQRII